MPVQHVHKNELDYSLLQPFTSNSKTIDRVNRVKED